LQSIGVAGPGRPGLSNATNSDKAATCCGCELKNETALSDRALIIFENHMPPR
jgi:hypothetical protein